jgi:hypothetical protein
VAAHRVPLLAGGQPRLWPLPRLLHLPGLRPVRRPRLLLHLRRLTSTTTRDEGTDRMDMDAYAKHQAELEEMHANYERMDQEEYEEFMAEMDARDAQRAQQADD